MSRFRFLPLRLGARGGRSERAMSGEVRPQPQRLRTSVVDAEEADSERADSRRTEERADSPASGAGVPSQPVQHSPCVCCVQVGSPHCFFVLKVNSSKCAQCLQAPQQHRALYGARVGCAQFWFLMFVSKSPCACVVWFGVYVPGRRSPSHSPSCGGAGRGGGVGVWGLVWFRVSWCGEGWLGLVYGWFRVSLGLVGWFRVWGPREPNTSFLHIWPFTSYSIFLLHRSSHSGATWARLFTTSDVE